MVVNLFTIWYIFVSENHRVWAHKNHKKAHKTPNMRRILNNIVKILLNHLETHTLGNQKEQCKWKTKVFAGKATGIQK